MSGRGALYRVPPQPIAPRLRLMCLPHAGGGAAVFRLWQSRLPDVAEVVSLQLPGRGWRLDEPPLTEIAAMVSEAGAALLELPPLPTVLFGHSLGAWLAFELAHHLRERNVSPVHLLVSGKGAPGAGHGTAPMAGLSDEDFVEAMVSRYGAIPPEVLEDAGALRATLPALRADMTAVEGYRYRKRPRLECGITALCGREDHLVSEADLDGWQEETTGWFRVRLLPGGHFYVDDPDPSLIEVIARELELAEQEHCG